MERITPRYETSSPLLAEQLRRNANDPNMLELPMPKAHWSKVMKEENKRLKAAVDYLQFQMRVTVQSRFDKYRNAKDSESTMAYRKCAQEMDTMLTSVNCVSNEILDGETQWDTETRQFIN